MTTTTPGIPKTFTHLRSLKHMAIFNSLSVIRSTYAFLEGFRTKSDFQYIQTYCMFVGYPRSGHTLIGSLLSAHPNVVIAHELDALRYLRVGLTRTQLYTLLLRRDRRFSSAGPKHSGYGYEVEGQWQGKYEKILVIGDKKGGNSTIWLGLRPWLLERLRKTVGVPLRIIHHVRNPYDNISTIARKHRASLHDATVDYFQLAYWVRGIRSRVASDEWIESYHEDFVADPHRSLSELLDFLNLPATAGYLDACSSIVFDSPKKSRQDAPWTDQLKKYVAERSQEFNFLRGYNFKS
jgi:hypothetical protein